MIETYIIIVPTFGRQEDMSNFNFKEQKRKLDVALQQEHYRVKLMNNYEYAGVLFTQYVLERRKRRIK